MIPEKIPTFHDSHGASRRYIIATTVFETWMNVLLAYAQYIMLNNLVAMQRA